MAVRITKFAGEFAALATWTGEREKQLRADEDYHAEDRDHWLAREGDLGRGALHPWRSPDGRLRLYYDKCRPDAYARLAGVIKAECFAMAGVDDQAMLAALGGAGRGSPRIAGRTTTRSQSAEPRWPSRRAFASSRPTRLSSSRS